MKDLIIILIAVVSTVFIVLLFRSLFKLIGFKTLKDGEDHKRILKMFMPTVVWAILMILFFVFVVPKY